MHFNFYGDSPSLNRKLVNNAAVSLENALNRNPSSANGPDGKSYPVIYKVTADIVSIDKAKELMSNNVEQNFDPRQNFVRVEENVSPDHLENTTWVHEVVAHGLNSRGKNSHLLDWEQNPDPNIPSIRTVKSSNKYVF